MRKSEVQALVLTTTLSLTTLLIGCSSPTPDPPGHIAFVSNRTGNDELYVINADGTDLTRLTHTETGELYPVWASDGSRIAFIRYTIPLFNRHAISIHALDVSTGSEVLINECKNHSNCELGCACTAHASISALWWSHGDECVAWEYGWDHHNNAFGETSSNDTPSENSPCLELSMQELGLWISGHKDYRSTLFTTGVALGEEERAIISGKGLVLRDDCSYVSSLSPDSRWLAFCAADEDDNLDIYILDIETAEIRRLTTDPSEDVIPNWSPVP